MKPITIIGGGVAGLSLGIGLRLRGIPVILFEAGRFPRHRVCGEFISGQGEAVLQRLHLKEKLAGCGARCARTVAFYGGGFRSELSLDQQAICISRFRFDSLLAATFQELGGDLKENSRWIDDTTRPFAVRATGRRPQPQIKGWRWFGLKAHATNVQLEDGLEMHFFPNAYIGLCNVERGLTNVCGLFRSRTPVQDVNRKWQELLRGHPESDLAQRTQSAIFDPGSFCSTAALSFRPAFRNRPAEFAIGDAFSAIAPLTGNGISLALESADLALDPLERYSASRIDWNDALAVTFERLTRAFAWRLRFAWWIQQALFLAPFRRFLLEIFRRDARLRNLMFHCTR